MARMAVDDGMEHQPRLVKLAGLGAGGVHASNELRDYRRDFFRRHGKTLEAQTIMLTLKDQDDKVQRVATEVIAPYEVMYWLYQSGLGNFHKSLLGTQSLESYWKHILAQPWAASHPLQKPGSEKFLKYTIPMVFFTDGAVFSKSSSAEGRRCCASWQGQS
jgi:hypothetical protein